jgi:hypothetical protein
MKITITDREVLSNLNPFEVASYLTSNAWEQIEIWGKKGSVWLHRSTPNVEVELLLPLDHQLSDFSSRMSDILSVLEVVEERSQLEILEDLTTAPADVIRVRAIHSTFADGSIPLGEGVGLVERGRDLLMAAACATVEPRAYFAARKPTPAVDYLKNVRLGQTERGSYVVKFLSRVPPSLEPTFAGQMSLDIADPFERLVTIKLLDALDATKSAASDFNSNYHFESFQKAVSQGVSANFCESLAHLGGGSASPRDIEIKLTWSRLRPTENTRPRRILVNADTIPIIEEAGRIFRETSPRDDFELVGIVVTLHRTEPDAPGKIVVLGFVDQSPRLVTVEISSTEYSKAILAHRDHIPVRCIGVLTKRSGSFSLASARHFELVSSNG